MNKKEIRKEIKTIISNISGKEEKEKIIISKLSQLLTKYENINILAYSALNDEPDLTDLLIQLEEAQNNVYISDIHTLGFRKLMDPINKSKVLKDYSLINVVLVPGRAFTKKGTRLGRGAGWYDKFLSEVKSELTVIGICFEEQILDNIPMEEHDKKVNIVVTDQDIYYN